MSNFTLEDIVELAWVSCSIVSRIVNEKLYVRDEVRIRVLEIIQNTRYHPNATAQTLASQCTWTVGLILPISGVFSLPIPTTLTSPRELPRSVTSMTILWRFS